MVAPAARAAAVVALVAALLLLAAPVRSHEIYTGLHGKNGQLCCGGTDCGPTVYREHAGDIEFRTREQTWVSIPQDRITFLSVPGDKPSDDEHHAHLCYRPATDADRAGPAAGSVFGAIFLYCAFIQPGAT